MCIRDRLAVYSAIIGVHFFLMGAGPAGMSAGLNALRTVISLRTRSLWVMTVFILLTLILGLGKPVSYTHLDVYKRQG